MLSMESAIVGAVICGFIEFIISGRVNSSANIPSVSASLLPISLESKMKIDPINRI